MDINSEVKALIIDLLDNHHTGGGDIDGLIKIDNDFYILEFLRCVSYPVTLSHPNKYWNYNEGKIGNKNKFLALWNIAQTVGGHLYLINYDDTHSIFKVIEVLALSDKEKIYAQDVKVMDVVVFKNWFVDLINRGS